jgi:aromatase
LIFTNDDYSRRELEALRLSSERLSLLVQQHSAGADAGEA